MSASETWLNLVQSCRGAALVAAAAAVCVSVCAPVTASAADEDGIPVTVRVIDATTELPIQTAVIRHPQEQDRHRVNTENGTWTGSVLYMPDGSELFFEKGMTLDFEVSAPGYVNQQVTYLVRRHRNEFPVKLVKLEIDMTTEDPDDITIQFGRDKPID